MPSFVKIGPLVLEKKIFEGFLPYMGLAATLVMSSLQLYSILSDIWVKIELCIPLESESSVLSTCNAFVCLSPPSKL